MKKRIALIFASLLALSTTGCNSNKDAFKPALDTKTKCSIVVNGHYDSFEALDEQILKFQKYYENVKITYSKITDYTKEATINDLFASDSAPDIYFISNGWENDSRYAKLFEVAEDLSDPKLNIDIASVREGLIYKDANNHVPYVPIFTNSYGMMVNEELFAKHNLSIPKTYTELVNVCNTLKTLGYESPVMSYNGSMYSLYFPYFLSTINGNKQAVDALNSLEASAGSYIRSGLEKVSDFMSHNFIDKDKCIAEIAKDNTDSICYRFYEGNVPMIFTEANRLSGSDKRETKSEAYQAHPFKYSFQPVPSSDNNGYFFNTLTLSFGVNKNSKNLAMTNEFMRFLVRSQSLNEICTSKRQISPAVTLGEDKLFNSFKEVLKSNRVFYNKTIGLSSAADTQVRKTFDAFTGGATIDEAITGYGSY